MPLTSLSRVLQDRSHDMIGPAYRITSEDMFTTEDITATVQTTSFPGFFPFLREKPWERGWGRRETLGTRLGHGKYRTETKNRERKCGWCTEGSGEDLESQK